MSCVRDLLARKGRDVVMVPTTASVREAAALMNERGVGAVLVGGGPGELAGIFTERDILRRVVAEGRDPAATRVHDVMTTALITCSPETTIDECAAVMTARRVRHLPVLSGSELQGLVSSGDVLAFRVAEQQGLIEELNRYIYDVR